MAQAHYHLSTGLSDRSSARPTGDCPDLRHQYAATANPRDRQSSQGWISESSNWCFGSSHIAQNSFQQTAGGGKQRLWWPTQTRAEGGEHLIAGAGMVDAVDHLFRAQFSTSLGQTCINPAMRSREGDRRG